MLIGSHLFEFGERAAEILGMQEKHRLAVGARLRLAVDPAARKETCDQHPDRRRGLLHLVLADLSHGSGVRSDPEHLPAGPLERVGPDMVRTPPTTKTSG